MTDKIGKIGASEQLGALLRVEVKHTYLQALG